MSKTFKEYLEVLSYQSYGEGYYGPESDQLWRAVNIGDAATVKKLLDAGLRWEDVEWAGELTSQAMKDGHKDIVRMLMDAGFRP